MFKEKVLNAMINVKDIIQQIYNILIIVKEKNVVIQDKVKYIIVKNAINPNIK